MYLDYRPISNVLMPHSSVASRPSNQTILNSSLGNIPVSHSHVLNCKSSVLEHLVFIGFQVHCLRAPCSIRTSKGVEISRDLGKSRRNGRFKLGELAAKCDIGLKEGALKASLRGRLISLILCFLAFSHCLFGAGERFAIPQLLDIPLLS